MIDPPAALDEIPILAESVPVTMPDLPARLPVTTLEQFRALSDPIRVRILGLIQNQPATAKQIADQLEATPGAIGHHLHLLVENGLAQVVARRLVRGVVAKYYTRTARLFEFDLPPEIAGANDVCLDILTQARSELAESYATGAGQPRFVALPHVRISPERARHFGDRLNTLLADLLQEPVDPNGLNYAVCLALFQAPPFAPPPPTSDSND